MSRQAKKFRELLDRPGVIISIGVYDTFSAKVAEREGFELLGIMGSLVVRAICGKPGETGYLTQTEMVDIARRIVQTVSVPVFVDCDDGFGHPMDVRRTVELVEQVGAAGLFIEDLKRPLRCSAVGGGSMIPAEDMVPKVRAAVEARSDPNFVIIARTDTYEGIDQVISRATHYAKAGADMVFPVGLTRVEDMERVAKESQIPLMAVQVIGTKIPLVAPTEFESMGYKVILYGRSLQGAAGLAIRNCARALKNDLKDKTKPPSLAGEMNITELEEIMGEAEEIELQKKYLV